MSVKKRWGQGQRALSPGKVVGGIKRTVLFLFILSGVVNVLALTGAIYMLQIYDRTLTSQSIPTLVAISILAIGLYLFQGALDVIRSQILVRTGAKFDQNLAPLAHKVTLDMPRFGFSLAETKERSRDVDVVRGFLSSQGPQAIFDLPFMPLYIAFIYFLHPWLGLMTIVGALILAFITLITEFVTRRRSSESNKADIIRTNVADAHIRNADVIYAMGLSERAVTRFEQKNAKHLALQTAMNDLSGTFSGVAKVLRMILQSAVLGLGAYLTIQGEMTAGAIIAASVAAARALAPIDLAISHWKSLVLARRSYHRLSETLKSWDDSNPLVTLPVPCQSLKVENITLAAPGTSTIVLRDVNIELMAGQALGLIGPTGGGKSSLARAVTGIWPLVRGAVRLDEADISQWPQEDRGRHMGYLPQEVSLMDGTIAENICRLDPDATGEKIIAAAKAACVHDLIVRLENGYETELGANGTALSGGQRQRIALARALYGDPFFVVLDEPNSNLDLEGDQALSQAIYSIKQRGGICIIIAHRPSAIEACDLVGVINGGKLVSLGERDQVFQDQMKRKRGNPQPVASLASGLKL